MRLEYDAFSNHFTVMMLLFCGYVFVNATVTNIFFVSLFYLINTLQSATGTTGLLSQVVIAVNHGCSVCVLDPSLGEVPIC